MGAQVGHPPPPSQDVECATLLRTMIMETMVKFMVGCACFIEFISVTVMVSRYGGWMRVLYDASDEDILRLRTHLLLGAWWLIVGRLI